MEFVAVTRLTQNRRTDLGWDFLGRTSIL